jgi:hypothetical protein
LSFNTNFREKPFSPEEEHHTRRHTPRKKTPKTSKAADLKDNKTPPLRRHVQRGLERLPRRSTSPNKELQEPDTDLKTRLKQWVVLQRLRAR